MAARWPRRLLRPDFLAAAVVATVAVALRLPACSESFWVDELHSAWAVWDPIGDVVARARAGHQSAFYFLGLWFWKQLVGGGELALRLSSVLAVAIGSGLLTAGLSRWTRSVTAGFVGGLLLAIEKNSIFFGTELRPYATVMLLGCIVFLLMLRLLKANSRQADPSAWCGLIVAILLATLCQPTAIGVLIWPIFFLALHWLLSDWRAFARFQVSDALLLVVSTAVLLYLWQATLSDSWSQRTTWAAFATATEPMQIWQIWDWTWLLFLPLTIAALSLVITKSKKGTGVISGSPHPHSGDPHSGALHSGALRSVTRGTSIAALIAFLCTGSYWLASFLEIAPLWHRRYFIAVLPCFAIVTAGSLGLLQHAVAESKRSSLLVAAVGFLIALTISWQQGVLASLQDYPAPLVRRGEDWRSAVAWVNERMEPDDLLFVDAGLIEAKQLLGKSDDDAIAAAEHDRQYLTYPVRGPYAAEHPAQPIKLSLAGSWQTVFKSSDRDRNVFVIARIPSRYIDSGGNRSLDVYSFGNLSVIVRSSD